MAGRPASCPRSAVGRASRRSRCITDSETRWLAKLMEFGVSFDQETEAPVHALGIISMQERACQAGGTLDVHSGLGHSTTVITRVTWVRHA